MRRMKKGPAQRAMTFQSKELDIFFAEHTPAVEEYLREYLSKMRHYPEVLYEAMEYSLFAGGKRVRPLLCLAGYMLFDDNWNKALPVASALEMIHTYSLIHDDLPAMDNDQMRRGKPTLHCEFNEYTAILAGDALLNMAFELLSDPESWKDIQASTQLEIIHSIGTASGAPGMIGGQMADIMTEKESLPVDLAMLEFIHTHKTGSLISVSLLSGARLSEKASEEEYKTLKEFSHLLGLLFQVVDDLLDVTGDEMEMGKNTHKTSEKMIYPRLIGIQETRNLARELTARAQEKIGLFEEKGRILQLLCEFFERRTY